MIRAFTVANELGDIVRCELENPYSNGVNVRNITGIGPEAVTIATNELAVVDGSVFSSQRAPERNITFDLSFMDMPDGEPVRHLTYKMFSIGTPVRLTFETDERNLYIDGWVESNSPSIFEEEEYTQISVVCPDPWFRSTSVIVARKLKDLIPQQHSIVKGFEFDKSYPEKTIEFDQPMSAVVGDAQYYGGFVNGYAIENPGDRPIGLVIKMTANKETRFSQAYIFELNDSRADAEQPERTMIQLASNIYLNYGDSIVYSTSPGTRMLYTMKRRDVGAGLGSVQPNVFGPPEGSDAYAVGNTYNSIGYDYPLRAPYRAYYIQPRPDEGLAWFKYVTQTRRLAFSPGDEAYLSGKPIPYGFRYDYEKETSAQCPVASEDVYRDFNEYFETAADPRPWKTSIAKTFESAVSTYDYLPLDPWDRATFDTATYPRAYIPQVYDLVGINSGVSGNYGGSGTYVPWLTLQRGVTMMSIDMRAYMYNDTPSSPATETKQVVTRNFDVEYELVPLYEGV